MWKILANAVFCFSILVISNLSHGTTLLFDKNNVGLVGGPWGALTLIQKDEKTVQFTVDPYESGFHAIGNNFGIQSFAFNFLGDGSQLEFEMPSGWSGKYEKDKIGGFDPFGKFDIEVKGTGSSRQVELVFYVVAPSAISISDFIEEVSTEGALFAGHIAGFTEGTITNAIFADPPPGSVPEPTTLLLLGSGLIGLAGYGRKKFFKK